MRKGTRGISKVAQFSTTLAAIEKRKIGSLDSVGLEGLSGQKIIACIQRATEIFCRGGVVYLETGVFRGLTLLSNAYKNRTTLCFGIDDFSLFDEAGKNLSIIRGHLKRLKIRNARIISRDFENALLSLKRHIGAKKVGVYFVDGPHDYRSQLIALLYIVPHLARECVIIIDDANYPHVRQATNDFLRAHPDFALLAEAYTPAHPANMAETEKKRAIEGWWNGVNILVQDPKHILRRRYPDEQNKYLYGESHDVFRHEFAGIAFDLLRLTQRIGNAEEATVLDEIKQRIAAHRKTNQNLYKHQNTYSDNLPRFKLYR